MVLHLATTSLLNTPFLLEVLVILGGIASGILAIVGVIAFTRNRSAPYLLVALALLLLLGKAGVGLLSLSGVVSVEFHNLLEHALDFLIATLLLGAILEARNPQGCGLGRYVGLEADR